MITVQVQYFAILREQRGVTEEKLSTGAGTAEALYEELRARHRFTLPLDLSLTRPHSGRLRSDHFPSCPKLLHPTHAVDFRSSGLMYDSR